MAACLVMPIIALTCAFCSSCTHTKLMLKRGSSAVKVSTKKFVHGVGPVSLTRRGSLGSQFETLGSSQPAHPVTENAASSNDVSVKQSKTSGSMPMALSETVTSVSRNVCPLRETATYVVPNGRRVRIRVYLPLGTKESRALHVVSGSSSRPQVSVSDGRTVFIPANSSTSAEPSDQ